MNLELITINDGDPSTREFRMKFDEAGGSIGRDASCDFVLPCKEKLVSRWHAEINLRNNQFTIRDSSANGVFINAQQEPLGHGNSQALNHGDVIGIGSHALKVIVAQTTGSSRASEDSNFNTSPSSHDISIFDKPRLEKAKVHQLHATTSNTLSPNTTSIHNSSSHIEKNISDLGDATDSFVAPNFSIPQNWDAELSTSGINRRAPEPKVSAPRFNEQENILIEGFLQGLGADKSVTTNQLTAEMMTTIGRTLRIAINGTLNNRQLLHETKSQLSLGEISVQRQMESDALSDITSIDVFIKTLVDPHNKLYSSLPQLLATSYIQSAEDQKEIYESIHLICEQFKDGLSPTAIEAAYKQHLQLEAPNAPLNKLGGRFSQSGKKWDFYRHEWKKICAGVSKSIYKNFESKILLTHAKRIRDKKQAIK